MFSLIQVGKILLNDNTCHWWGCGEMGIHISCWWDNKLAQVFRGWLVNIFFFFLNSLCCFFVLFFFLIYLFIYLFYFWLCWVFVSVRGLSLLAASRGHSSLRCAGLSLSWPLVAEYRLQMRRLSSCGSRAQLLRSMWDLPRPGLEPVSPELAGRFSTTAPPGKPHQYLLKQNVYMLWSTISPFKRLPNCANMCVQ